MSASAPDVDVTTAAFKAKAYSIYADWRRNTPVKPVALPDGQTIWLVTRYDDVVSVLKDERLLVPGLKLIGPHEHFESATARARRLNPNQTDLADARKLGLQRGPALDGCSPSKNFVHDGTRTSISL